MILDNKEPTKDRIKGLLIGVGIFLTPFINFLSDVNLKQLEAEQIAIIGLSLVPFLVSVFILSWVISLLPIRRPTLATYTLFPLLSVGFYLQFHYKALLSLLLVPTNTVLFAGILTVCILGTAWLVIILLGLRYSSLIRRVLGIFTLLVLSISLVPSLNHLMDYSLSWQNVPSKDVEVNKFVGNSLLSSTTIDQSQLGHSSSIYPNVYFIIADGMLSLEAASDLGIVDINRELGRLKEADIHYVEGTYSSYDVTNLTLASVLSLAYPQTEASRPYVNNAAFFPLAMRSETYGEPSFLLLSLLNKIGVRFVWQGNSWARCISSSRNWICADSSDDQTSRLKRKIFDLMSPATPFYRSSVIGAISRRLNRGSDDVEHSLIRFMIELETLIGRGGPIFAFVHHLAPHDPYRKTQDCKSTNEEIWQNKYQGYRHNYLCTLREIHQFLAMIDAVDSNSIVVIQGDHGYDVSNPANTLATADRSSSIFNAVRAPSRCFKNYGVPRSTVNSIRFVMNCAYSFKFPFDKVLHYSTFLESDNRFGKVIMHDVCQLEGECY